MQVNNHLQVFVITSVLINQEQTLLFFQDEQTGEITFYLKGADVVMTSIVQYNDWLEEEVRCLLDVWREVNVIKLCYWC